MLRKNTQKTAKSLTREWRFGPMMLLFLVFYFGQSFTELNSFVGRYSDEVAAILSPPYFGYGACYETGDVLGYSVGSSLEELAANLEKNVEDLIWLESSYDPDLQLEYATKLYFENQADFLNWAKGKIVLNGRASDRKLGFEFHIQNEYVTKICTAKRSFDLTL